MMADHLDIKIFTDILVQVRTVHVDQKRHSSISTTIDVIGASDTEGEGEAEEKEVLKVVTPMVTPASARKAHPPIIKKVNKNLAFKSLTLHCIMQSSTATNLVKQLGIDHDIIKEMIADG